MQIIGEDIEHHYIKQSIEEISSAHPCLSDLKQVERIPRSCTMQKDRRIVVLILQPHFNNLSSFEHL